MYTKTCHGCRKSKELESFSFYNKKLNKRRTSCRECEAIRYQKYKKQEGDRLRKSWRDASKKYHSPETRRHRTLKKYGIDQSDYELMYDTQNGCCAICKLKIALVIDHCHSSGQVRGLLCNGCNLGLGYFKDNIVNLEQAKIYIDAG